MRTDFDSMKFTRFYRFPHIEKLRAFARLKLYQTILICGTTPIMIYAKCTDVIDTSTLTTSIGGAVFTCIALYAISGYTRNFIGVMAMNDGKDVLRVSHLTFWGGRREIYAPVDDVIPLTDAGEDVNELYLKFKRYSNNSVLYYSVRFGGVESLDDFRKVFGNVAVPVSHKKR